jgi:hypothetical protein
VRLLATSLAAPLLETFTTHLLELVPKNDMQPIENLVPDANTAIKIGVAVLLPIFGSVVVGRESPFKASLNGENWIVEGQLPETMLGTVATVEIAKRDGRIIEILHTK